MTNNVEYYSTGMLDITGVTFLILLILKLFKLIDISWWWVTVPLWGPLTLLLLIFIIFYVITLLRI